MERCKKNKAQLLLKHKHQIMGFLSMICESVEEAEVELFVSKRFGIFQYSEIYSLPCDVWTELEDWIERWLDNQECAISEEAEHILYNVPMALNAAKRDIQLYLNCCGRDLPDALSGKVLELALVHYQGNQGNNPQAVGLKSMTYSEGDVSQSVTYLTAQDVQTAKDAVLRSIAHYRRRAKWD